MATINSSGSVQESGNYIPVKLSFVLPIDGFQEECSLFLKEAVSLPKFNFTTFRELFENCKFDRLYEARASKEEIMEMSEQIIITVTTHFVIKNASYQERTAALFLLYIFALSQPIQDFAKIPITPDDVQCIRKYLEEAHLLQDKEVLFCWANILVRGHCEFTAERQEYGLEDSIQKYFDDVMEEDNASHPLRDFKEEFTILENFTVKMKKYNELKKKYMMRGAISNKDRKLLEQKWRNEMEGRENMANKLITGLRNMITGSEGVTKSDNEHRVHSEKIEKLKKEASWSQVRKGRYLTSTVDESIIQPDGEKELDDDDDYRDSDMKMELETEQLLSHTINKTASLQPSREVADRIKDKMITCREILNKPPTTDIDDCSQDSLYFIPPSYPTMIIDDYSLPASPVVTSTNGKEMNQQPGPSGPS